MIILFCDLSLSNRMEQNTIQKNIKRQLIKRKTIPESLLNDPVLKEAINCLPSKYNFEIYKTIFRIREAKAKVVALQFPEGLMVYFYFTHPATFLSDTILDTLVVLQIFYIISPEQK